jgi:hypothetical protein
VTETILLPILGVLVLLVGGWVVIYFPSLFMDGVILMGIGLGIQCVATWRLVRAYRADVGPGRHRRSRQKDRP